LDEGTAEILRGANDQEDINLASQRAIDMTTDFVFQRLSLQVVVKLVTISLFTLPDEMPAIFQSTYTDIQSAASEVIFIKLLQSVVFRNNANTYLAFWLFN
jgi:hypothetical protein